MMDTKDMDLDALRTAFEKACDAVFAGQKEVFEKHAKEDEDEECDRDKMHVIQGAIQACREDNDSDDDAFIGSPVIVEDATYGMIFCGAVVFKEGMRVTLLDARCIETSDYSPVELASDEDNVDFSKLEISKTLPLVCIPTRFIAVVSCQFHMRLLDVKPQ